RPTQRVAGKAVRPRDRPVIESRAVVRGHRPSLLRTGGSPVGGATITRFPFTPQLRFAPFYRDFPI
ncbi:MAG: hypothetical protein KKG96_06910, partial [Proteobacteria bacterium]|nr:hypothetical protein [Pseudomonadota bacterium]